MSIIKGFSKITGAENLGKYKSFSEWLKEHDDSTVESFRQELHRHLQPIIEGEEIALDVVLADIDLIADKMRNKL